MIISLPLCLECTSACQALVGSVLISGCVSWLRLLDDPRLLGISRNLSPSPKLSSVFVSVQLSPWSPELLSFLCWSAAASVSQGSFSESQITKPFHSHGPGKTHQTCRFYAGWALGPMWQFCFRLREGLRGLDTQNWRRRPAWHTSYTAGFYSERLVFRRLTTPRRLFWLLLPKSCFTNGEPSHLLQTTRPIPAQI